MAICSYFDNHKFDIFDTLVQLSVSPYPSMLCTGKFPCVQWHLRAKFLVFWFLSLMFHWH